MIPDGLIAAIIYAAALVYIIIKNLRAPVLWDVRDEYRQYQGIFAGLKQDGHMSSCLLTTWLPYWLVRYLRAKPESAFRLAPAFFYALVFPFTYLTARGFTGTWEALAACGFIFVHNTVIYFPANGRVGVGMGLYAGLIWSILSGCPWAAAVFIILIITSYYAMAYYAVAVIGLGWLFSYIAGARGEIFITLSFACVCLVTGTWFWYGIVNRKMGSTAGRMVAQSIFGSSADYREYIVPMPGKKDTRWHNFLERQPPVLRAALGYGFGRLPLIIKIEWCTSWSLILIMTAGCIKTALGGGIGTEHLFIGAAACIALGISVFIPEITHKYAPDRPYIYLVLIAAPCFPAGAGLFGIAWYWAALPLLALHALVVSGLGHRLMGEKKTVRDDTPGQPDFKLTVKRKEADHAPIRQR